jgi:hypothetical protein
MRRSPALALTRLVVCALAVALLTAGVAWATEIQLAGIRLGQNALSVQQVYGQPDCVILGTIGAGTIASSVGVAGASGAASGFAGGGGEGGPPPGGPPAGPGGLGAPPGFGMAPATVAAAGGVVARFAASRDIPDWANIVLTPMTTHELMWCYRRGDVALGFVLDREGYVVAIVVGGKDCDWARTALGEPQRQVKLGDSFQRVIDRYGYPEDTSVAPVVGFSQDVTANFGYNNNIQFTLRDLRVRRIYIWESQLRREVPVRLPSAGFGMAAGLDETLPAAAHKESGFRH